MSCRLNKTVLSSVCFETVRVCWVMQAGLVADHSRHRVQTPETAKLRGNTESNIEWVNVRCSRLHGYSWTWTRTVDKTKQQTSNGLWCPAGQDTNWKGKFSGEGLSRGCPVRTVRWNCLGVKCPEKC